MRVLEFLGQRSAEGCIWLEDRHKEQENHFSDVTGSGHLVGVTASGLRCGPKKHPSDVDILVLKSHFEG